MLGEAGPHTWLARRVLHAFNRQGGFDNLDDSEATITAMLEASFRQVVARALRTVPGLDHQDARVFMPADHRLIEMARGLAGERGTPVTSRALVAQHARLAAEGGGALVVLLGPASSVGRALDARRPDLAGATLAFELLCLLAEAFGARRACIERSRHTRVMQIGQEPTEA